MDTSRARRWPWLAVFLVGVAVSSGCDMPKSGGTTSASSTSSSGEAERTRKIEAKAAEIERHAQEIQAMTGTEQEKIDAVNRLDQERRELQELQDAAPEP
jgi:hypothetical protein